MGTSKAVVCPFAANHTPSPEGYTAWHSWAEQKSKTHKQRRCRGCGLFMVWYPKKHAHKWEKHSVSEIAPMMQVEEWEECTICGKCREIQPQFPEHQS